MRMYMCVWVWSCSLQRATYIVYVAALVKLWSELLLDNSELWRELLRERESMLTVDMESVSEGKIDAQTYVQLTCCCVFWI